MGTPNCSIRAGTNSTMHLFSLALTLPILLGQLCLVVHTRRCATDEVEVILRVEVEFFKQALESSSSYHLDIDSKEEFSKTLNDMSTSASVSGGYGGFTASASGSYSKLTEECTSTKSYAENEEELETTFNIGFFQIWRIVKSTLTINRKEGTSTEKRFVDSIPKSEDVTQEQLEQRAKDYMTFNYGDKAVGSTFTESACQEKVAKAKAVQAAKLEFKGGYDGNKEDRFLNFKDDRSCENNEARSVYLTGALAGTKITIFDSRQGKENNDFTVIKVKGNMGPRERILIGNLERSYHFSLADGGSVQVKHHGDDGLNGKVTSVDIVLW